MSSRHALGHFSGLVRVVGGGTYFREQTDEPHRRAVLQVNVKMDPGWEKSLGDMAVRAMSERYQPILDGLHDEFAGRPIDEIKPVLARRWAEGNEGASITEPELTNVAQAISDGKRVVMTDGRLTS